MVQGMMQHMMAKLREVGLKVPQGQRGEVLIPPIVYHQGQQRFPGETVEEAARQGAAFFKAGPQIIFVLLPDNCEPSLRTSCLAFFTLPPVTCICYGLSSSFLGSHSVMNAIASGIGCPGALFGPHGSSVTAPKTSKHALLLKFLARIATQSWMTKYPVVQP